MTVEKFEENGAKYFIYDQRLPCRKDENGVIQYLMGGVWQSNENLSKNWDTLADPVDKSAIDAMVTAKALKSSAG